MKKLLLGLGTLTAVAVPVVAVVSCGDNKPQTKTELHIEVKQGTVEPHIQVNTINKITQGTLTVSEIDSINHILLIEDMYKIQYLVNGRGQTVGGGLTTIQGTKEIYETFGLTGSNPRGRK